MANHYAALPAVPELSDVFYALADPTRRAVVTMLGRGPETVSALAAPFAMALPSFLKHLQVLERSGLIRSRKTGRVRTCELVPQPLSIGTLTLADGSSVQGFLCEALATQGARDISQYGGWRAYMASPASSSSTSSPA